MFLSPEFGPMVRFAFLFTDAPLEPDPMYNGEPFVLNAWLVPGNARPMPEHRQI